MEGWREGGRGLIDGWVGLMLQVSALTSKLDESKVRTHLIPYYPWEPALLRDDHHADVPPLPLVVCLFVCCPWLLPLALGCHPVPVGAPGGRDRGAERQVPGLLQEDTGAAGRTRGE